MHLASVPTARQREGASGFLYCTRKYNDIINQRQCKASRCFASAEVKHMHTERWLTGEPARRTPAEGLRPSQGCFTHLIWMMYNFWKFNQATIRVDVSFRRAKSALSSDLSRQMNYAKLVLLSFLFPAGIPIPSVISCVHVDEGELAKWEGFNISKRRSRQEKFWQMHEACLCHMDPPSR